MNLDLKRSIDILTGKLENWLEGLTSMVPNFVVAIFILTIFYFLARVVRNITGRILTKFSKKGAIHDLFSTIAYLLTFGIGVIMALNVLHLQQTVASLLAGAGIIGLALGFAFQDITANFISGVLLAFRKPIRVGDIIKTQDFTGIVENINLRVTIIKTFQGLHVLIPNKDIFQSALTNFTKTNERRIDLEVGVSYSEDLHRVKNIAIEAVSKLSQLLPNQEVKLSYKEFGASSINFVIMIWVRYPNELGFLEARSDAIMAIKGAFDKNNITIPFPIRTLDFGIKGGQKLSEMPLSLAQETDLVHQ